MTVTGIDIRDVPCKQGFVLDHYILLILKTVILSWLQNDGTRGFSVDQKEKKKLLPMF